MSKRLSLQSLTSLETSTIHGVRFLLGVLVLDLYLHFGPVDVLTTLHQTGQVRVLTTDSTGRAAAHLGGYLLLNLARLLGHFAVLLVQLFHLFIQLAISLVV